MVCVFICNLATVPMVSNIYLQLLDLESLRRLEHTSGFACPWRHSKDEHLGEAGKTCPECTWMYTAPSQEEMEQDSRAPTLISASWPTEMWARCHKLLLTGKEAGPAAIPSLGWLCCPSLLLCWAGLYPKTESWNKSFLSCLLLLSLWSQNTKLANTLRSNRGVSQLAGSQLSLEFKS